MGVFDVEEAQGGSRKVQGKEWRSVQDTVLSMTL